MTTDPVPQTLVAAGVQLLIADGWLGHEEPLDRKNLANISEAVLRVHVDQESYQYGYGYAQALGSVKSMWVNLQCADADPDPTVRAIRAVRLQAIGDCVAAMEAAFDGPGREAKLPYPGYDENCGGCRSRVAHCTQHDPR